MSPRDFVTFSADFPDDAEWDEREDLVVPGGKAIAAVLRDWLHRNGWCCTDVVQHSFYGWAFDSTRENVIVWCVVAAAENGWLLLMETRGGLLSRLFGSGRAEGFEHFQDCVQEMLMSDKRFSKVLWYTRRDYEAQNQSQATPTPRGKNERPDHGPRQLSRQLSPEVGRRREVAMPAMPWWYFGLIGGGVLSLVTAIKAVGAIARGTFSGAEWGQAAGFGVTVFGMGFFCGVVVWAGRGLYGRIGMAGDAIVGAVVMLLFFVMCMILFDPDLLGNKFRSGGVWMLALATLTGLIAGPWIGRDLRK